MADILDAAQQQINAAAGGTPPAGDVPAPDPAIPVVPATPVSSTPVAPSTDTPAPASEAPKTETPVVEPVKPVDDVPLPPEKPLVVPATGTPTPATETPTPQPATDQPLTETPAATPEPKPEATTMPTAQPSTIKDQQSTTPPPEPAPPAPVAPSDTPPKKSGKGGSKIAVIVGVIMLLFSLPLGVFFVSQQQQLADVRSRASGCGPAPCSVTCSNGQSFSDSCLPTFGSCDQWAKEACGTVNSDSGGSGGGGGGGGGGNGGGDNMGPPVCLDANTCVRRINGVNTPVANSECAGKLCGSEPSIPSSCAIKSCPSGQIPTDFASNGCPGRCVTPASGGGGGGGGGGDDSKIVNPGTNDKSCNNNTGSCTADGDQNLVVCYCSPDELVTEEEARAAGKYPEAVGSCPLCETKPGGSSASCKQEAKNSCKVVQLDIVSPNDPTKIIDTIVCNPPANCSTAQGGVAEIDGGDGGGGGDKTKKKLSCQKLRIFKAGKKVDEKDWPKLKAGDAITFVVDHQEAKKARVRVNGAAWTETTKKKDGDFLLDFTIPTGVTTFTIEAEVNKKGDQWK